MHFFRKCILPKVFIDANIPLWCSVSQDIPRSSLKTFSPRPPKPLLPGRRREQDAERPGAEVADCPQRLRQEGGHYGSAGLERFLGGGSRFGEFLVFFLSFGGGVEVILWCFYSFGGVLKCLFGVFCWIF